jgi:hypothetical protein
VDASNEVADALRRYIEGLAAADRAAIDAMISREAGVTAIGSDPSEIWHSGEEWSAKLGGLLGQIGGLPVKPREPHGFAEGSVGWAYDLPILTLPGHDELSFRMAAVFHREADDWKLVMLHASLAVDVQQLMQ